MIKNTLVQVLYMELNEEYLTPEICDNLKDEYNVEHVRIGIFDPWRYKTIILDCCKVRGLRDCPTSKVIDLFNFIVESAFDDGHNVILINTNFPGFNTKNLNEYIIIRKDLKSAIEFIDECN